MDKDDPKRLPPSIHANYYPTFGIKPGQPVNFLVRTFRTTDGKETWESCRDITSSFLGGGRFEVHGETSPVRHRLAFSAWNRRAPLVPVEFQPGERDLQVALVSRSAIEATALLPHDLPRGLDAEMRRGGVAVPPSQDGTGPMRAMPMQMDGDRYRLTWPAVRPGTYTLAFVVRGITEPLATIAGLTVPLPPDGDPRLRDIDLRDRVRAIVVHVNDREGRPVTGRVSGFVQPQDPGADWFGLPARDGDFRMAVPQKPVDLWIVAEGLPPKLLRDARGETSVQLEPWPERPLVLTGLPPLGDAELVVWRGSPAPRFTGRYHSDQDGPVESLFQPPPGPAKATDGKVTLALGEGAHPLVFQLERPGGSAVQLKQFAPLEVTAGAVPLEIRFSTEEVEQTLAKLRASGK
jgi:hypothetical protein